MQLKTTAPSDEQTLSEVFSQMLTNDTVNQTVDDTAILDTGIGRGNVVKYSRASGKWVLCNGTVKLNSTDTVGIVEYANGTSGQVRTSGVYLDANLTSTLPYYCQSDGTLGITATKIFMGCIASSGRFMMVSGSGGSSQPATTEELGGIIVGNGLNIDGNGLLSSAHGSQMFTSNGTFTVPTGVTTVYVSGCGGGGGGGGCGQYHGGGLGGHRSEIIINRRLAVTAEQGYTITIGNGGTGGTGNGGNGGTGGTSSFGALLSMSGGTGGLGGQDSGGQDSGTNGDSQSLNIFINASGGTGAGSILGGSGVGAGGGASIVYNQSAGAGATGIIFVEW